MIGEVCKTTREPEAAEKLTAVGDPEHLIRTMPAKGARLADAHVERLTTPPKGIAVEQQQVREATVVRRGDVSEEMVEYARDQLRPVVAHASASVLGVELRLDRHADPARDRPNHVEATIDLDGTLIRAHRSAETMTEAIDSAVARLRRRVESAEETPQSRQLRHRDLESWHRGDQPTDRPDFYPRPVDDRVLVRRKTFALHAESIEEALFDLETLDHDFFLFVDADTNAEAVVYRTGDGYGLIQRMPTPEAIARVEIPLGVGPAPATKTLQDALALLDETGAPFDFFVDAPTGHGQIAYRRYDGNYGLIYAT